MLKVALVGCGKIADAHASQIQRIGGCQIVAVCDREPLMAQQLAERFQAGRPYSDMVQMLAEARPDVVHITTPPQSHFALALQCLESGAHVYVEKPFTLNTPDAEKLIEVATGRERRITAGHDYQFRHVARRMRAAVREGCLGGPPVHMESCYCYELTESSEYARALLGDKQHWVRKLPGQLLHNVISHGIARIAEFLPGDRPWVFAHGMVSPLLTGMGEHEIVDELRVLLAAEDGTTASFTFSSQMRPSLNQFRLYGPRHGLLLDSENETLIHLRGTRYKSYLEQFVAPLVLARQYLANAFHNMGLFLANDFHVKAGMKHLIESFYASITQGAPLPIPYREILMTSRIMDEIFDQIAGRKLPTAGPRQARVPARPLGR